MLCSHWTPGGPRSGSHLDIPDDKKRAQLGESGPVVIGGGHLRCNHAEP